jgi:DNA modification methylase
MLYFVKDKIPKDLLEYFEPAECGRCYICKLVEVFREVKRTLKDDGTLWLNLGDSYYTSAPGNNNNKTTDIDGVYNRRMIRQLGHGEDKGLIYKKLSGYKQKDLLGIPWRVAFALQADGWYLRQEIIWAKPNPMPESVKDRCTKSHEYLFLLAKNQKYYFDNDAIREPHVARENRPYGVVRDRRLGYNSKQSKLRKSPPNKGNIDNHKNKYAGMASHLTADGFIPNAYYHPLGRNKRSVWTITTKPYKEAHFATYPPELVTPCVLAGSREGDVVLDPFIGSGTTAYVAKKLGRQYLGIELNPEYVDMANKRLTQLQERLL